MEKGKEAERAVCRLIGKWLGIEVKRNLAQARERGQQDILGVEGWLIQVKQRKRLELDAWWRTLVEEARERGLEPCLWWRPDGGKWMVRMEVTPYDAAIDVLPLTWLELVRARMV
jgi:hypothetical protein